MEIFIISKTFPKEERYSLTDQIRRSSRNVCANVGEAYRKRNYPKLFSLKITDADGECSETMVWLDFAFDCSYIDKETYDRLTTTCIQVGKMLGRMTENPEKFLPKHKAVGPEST